MRVFEDGVTPGERSGPVNLPRVMIAGLAGDTGKTLVSLGLMGALRARNMRCAPFKKGPDFIDAAWLGAAAGVAGRNLDTFLMPQTAILDSLARASGSADIAVIEGNRGLFDGLDAAGTHSSAELAKLIGTPVVLVIDATKTTRTVAAQVKGCQALDPDLALAGVILNRVGTSRQQAVIREAVAIETGLPVLGAIPRLAGSSLPGRHLGLVTAVEHPDAAQALQDVTRAVQQYVDIPALIDAARAASGLPQALAPAKTPGEKLRVKIGVLQDRAFSFYYPENLTSLEDAGAQLVSISPLNDSELPDIDALYAGGGFPEVHAGQLSNNKALIKALARRIEQGLPVWAECGGLMYLSRAVRHHGKVHPMLGVLPFAVEQNQRPQGHGYVQARVDRANPFFAQGTELRGHEFHYSQLDDVQRPFETVLSLSRGTGVGAQRDGVRVGNVVAAYTHLHALGARGWAAGLVRAAAGKQPLKVTQSGRSRPARPTGLAAHRTKNHGKAAQPAHVKPAIEQDDRPAGRRREAGLRSRVEQVVQHGRPEELQALVCKDGRAVRYLLAMSYQSDAEVRRRAARGIALAGRYHRKAVQRVIKRLVWAMNDESGTNAVTAPEVLRAISQEQPELLLPVVTDLMRLAADAGLQKGISEALREVTRRCPGEVGKQLGKELTERIERGDVCGIKNTH